MGDVWRRDQDRIRPVPLSYKQRESGGNFRKGDFASSGKDGLESLGPPGARELSG